MITSLEGIFGGRHVVVGLDISQDTSVISEDHVLFHRLPQKYETKKGLYTTRKTSGKIAIPTKSGYYVSEISLRIGSFTAYDILLGSDWIDANHIRLDDSSILDPVPEVTFCLPFDSVWLAGCLLLPPFSDDILRQQPIRLASDIADIFARFQANQNVQKFLSSHNDCPKSPQVVPFPPTGAFQLRMNIHCGT
jgi:hypothetical protein